MIKETTVSWLEIPYITLTFCLRFLKPSEVPEQKVSALRGGLGEMLLRKNCVADRNCDECRFQDSCIVWNAFYTPMRFKPAYMTGKESLGYLIECDNQETDMDPRHGFVFRLKLFGRNIALFSQYLDAFWQLGQAGIGKDHAGYLYRSERERRAGMKLLIEMTLQSDAVFGNGLSIPGGEDIATQMDDAGFPYLKGNTFKGIFREELINLLSWTGKDTAETDHIVCTLMGEGGSELLDESRKVSFSDLVVHPLLRSAAEEETGDLSEHKAMFTYTRDFTSLENGMAKEGSLRQCRCVKSGFHFYGTCVCDAQDAELVKEVLGLIKWVGTMRNRGFGEVSICVEDQHE